MRTKIATPGCVIEHYRTWYDVPSDMLPTLRRVKMAGPSDTLIPTTRLHDVIKQTIAVEIFIAVKNSNHVE
jgi:hypothetical protein